MLKELLTKKTRDLNAAILNSTTDTIIFDDIEINKDTAVELKNEFEDFLNSNQLLKRIFIPIKLINKDEDWKNKRINFYNKRFFNK